MMVLTAIGMLAAAISGLATAAVLAAFVINAVHDKLKARSADVTVVHHPEFGYMFHLNHRGRVMHDGFYATDTEAIQAAALEAERMKVKR